jgi:hypothetical protein
MLEIVGKTTEGKFVLKGVYRLFETSGVPLDFIFDYVHMNDMVISWIDLHKEAQGNGMKHKRILTKLEEPVTNIWGAEYWEVVKKNLELYFGKP